MQRIISQSLHFHMIFVLYLSSVPDFEFSLRIEMAAVQNANTENLLASLIHTTIQLIDLERLWISMHFACFRSVCICI